MNKCKKPLLFALALLPAAIIGGLFVILYQLDALDPAIVNEAVAEIGSKTLLVGISVLQSIAYALLCGFFGYMMAVKTGLIQELRIKKGPFTVSLLLSLAGGLIFALDPWMFGRIIPEVGPASVELTLNRFIGSVLYGGIIEEVMLRLFFMSLMSLIIWKLFFRRQPEAPKAALIVANIVAALLFAAGHLPATFALFGRIDAALLFRCFLLNGGFGLMFGYLFRKYGIQYAMLSHMSLHIFSQVIWFIFI